MNDIKQAWRYIDDDFLAKIMDSNYSNEWVGIALRWQINAAPQVSAIPRLEVGAPTLGQIERPSSGPGPADAAPIKQINGHFCCHPWRGAGPEPAHWSCCGVKVYRSYADYCDD